MTTTIKLAVVDDHPLYREGVTRTLLQIGGFEVVGEGSTKEDALRITEAYRPDVVLMNISMPGGGLSAIPLILERYPDQKIVMLTISEAIDDLITALSSGARGYVLKGVGARTLAEILRAVASGEKYVSPTLSARVLTDLAGKSVSSAPAGVLAGLRVESERC